jgi:hypothetical protein
MDPGAVYLRSVRVPSRRADVFFYGLFMSPWQKQSRKRVSVIAFVVDIIRRINSSNSRFFNLAAEARGGRRPEGL